MKRRPHRASSPASMRHGGPVDSPRCASSGASPISA
jgi:hypothetical protein